MIRKHIQVHDKYTVEIKLGFQVDTETPKNDFSMDLWLFIPDSLDKNRFTYLKSDFYNDVRTYTRLITPIYRLEDVADPDGLPFRLLGKSIHNLIRSGDTANRESYEYHIKMFVSIVKSALRDEVHNLVSGNSPEKTEAQVRAFIRNAEAVCKGYRSLWYSIYAAGCSRDIREYFCFCNEFLSNITELHAFKLMHNLHRMQLKNYSTLQKGLSALIRSETEYRQAHGYPCIQEESRNRNLDFVFRMGLLKKYVESHLFLDIKRRWSGLVTEQILLSLAAGIAMIFATVVSFVFQKKFGNFTLPLFVVLVVSYMLKDRIKDLCRFYFAQKTGTRYFDHRIEMSANGCRIGQLKQAMDFIIEDKIPADILKKRNRSPLIEADNRVYTERALLYRTRMKVQTAALLSSSRYPIAGINSIIRMNLSRMIQKMDNSDFPLYCPHETDGYKIIKGERMYFLNLLLKMGHGSGSRLRHYRIAINRNGIRSIVAVR